MAALSFSSFPPGTNESDPPHDVDNGLNDDDDDDEWRTGPHMFR